MDQNFNQTVLDAGKALGLPLVVTDPRSVSIVPLGYTVEDLAKYAEQPRRIKARPIFHDADSFCDYVTAFKNPDSRIFAVVPAPGAGAPSFDAIIDYHGADNASNKPHWCDHKAAYTCQFTVEWNRWMAGNKKRMEQTQFAEHLELNQSVIKNPNGAVLLELIQTLEGKSDVKISSAIKLSNGKIKFAYEDDVILRGTTTITPGEMELPQTLDLGIQMFEGGLGYNFSARLRYRLENRKLTFWYECIDLHVIIKDAVDGVIDRIQEKTGIQPLFGTP